MTTIRKFHISTAPNRFAKVWKGREVCWEELLERLRNPVETPESFAEYMAMGRERQTEVKDVGGFVGGMLRNGVRKAEAVVSRSLVTLDFDAFSAARLVELREGLEGLAWAVHSTHKHSPEGWRVRVVIPLGSDVDGERYVAVARRLAARIGMEGIDRSTFEPVRMMFWGSHSRGAEYLFEEGTGRFADPEEILAEYVDWRDVSQWPMVAEEEALLSAEGTEEGPSATVLRALGGLARNARMEDPKGKAGVVGAFCRTYGCRDVIETLVPGVYERAGQRGRYTYVNGSASGGAWLRGDFFYSFHSTDPLGGRMLNSWDLMRLLKFGDLDRGVKAETRAGRLPSFQAMEEWALKDARVKVRLIDERQAAIDEDFAGFELEDFAAGAAGADADLRAAGADADLRAAGAAGADADLRAEPSARLDTGGREADTGGREAALREWEAAKGELELTKGGAVKSTIANCVIILRSHPRFAGKIRRNEFTGDIEVFGRLPWRRETRQWGNIDDSCLRVWLDKRYGIGGKEKISDALTDVANGAGFHPVRDYLSGLKWDGVRRVERLFTDLLGAEDSEVNRALARLLLTAAVRRIRQPGVKFDYFIILQGPEGCGKSSLFSLLGGEWFSDSVITVEGKEGMESIQGKWIIELGELVGVKRSEQASVKGFISRQTDEYRPAYGRIKEKHPRQCVLVGTTNEEYFLRGTDTGNRRSPVVEIRPELRRIVAPVREWVAEHRDQIWAEAVELEREAGALYLDAELTAAVEEIQDRHNLDKSDVRFPEVARFLDILLPDRWEEMSQVERLRWLRNEATDVRGSEEEG